MPAVVFEVEGREWEATGRELEPAVREEAGFLVAVVEWTAGEENPPLAGAFFFGGVDPWAPNTITASAPATAQNSTLRMVLKQFTRIRHVLGRHFG